MNARASSGSTGIRAAALLARLGVAAVFAITTFGTAAAAGLNPGTNFVRYEIVDPAQGGMIVATLAMPQGWRGASRVDWDYQSANNAARPRVRVAAPDGSAWVEGYPREVFSWLNVRSQTPVGGHLFGMINYPNITAREALLRFVVGRERGNRKNLKIVGERPVANLAARLAGQQIPGDSLAIRIRYDDNGVAMEEDFYGFLGERIKIPYDGPQGRTYEYHRTLALVHSLGARQGELDRLYPLLGFIAASGQPNPLWQKQLERVSTAITQEFNRQLAAGYAQIAAAGRVSRAISANNDAMLAGMASARARSNAEYTARRQASAEKASSDFSGYIRGTEKMNDPYWGTSDHSYTDKYHWSDGQGNYRHSNDAGFNPNVGAGGGPSWTLMTPAR